MNALYVYLVIINVVTATLFTYDKVAARSGKRRIPELILHGFELAGGVFVVVLLMYLISHKSRKVSYYWKTYLLLIIWSVIIWFVFFQF